jgi:hypothetical protein
VDQILKGAQAGDLPIRQTINARAAEPSSSVSSFVVFQEPPSCVRCLCTIQGASDYSPTVPGRIRCGNRSRRETELFDGAFAWSRPEFQSVEERPERIAGCAYVSGRFFETLGVPAFRGRMLTPADDSTAQPDGRRDQDELAERGEDSTGEITPGPDPSSQRAVPPNGERPAS